MRRNIILTAFSLLISVPAVAHSKPVASASEVSAPATPSYEVINRLYWEASFVERYVGNRLCAISGPDREKQIETFHGSLKKLRAMRERIRALWPDVISTGRPAGLTYFPPSQSLCEHEDATRDLLFSYTSLVKSLDLLLTLLEQDQTASRQMDS